MKIFCSGIGGIGLSAYAGHMLALGHDVHGSDASVSPIIDDLRSLGATVEAIQDGSALPEGIDLFVYSEAIPETSPERKKAKELGIPEQSYFQALGTLTEGKDLIAVCGTHGKSTTTAMAAKVFIDAGKDPNVVVGTKMKELNGRNWRKGSGDLWIVEACEYRNSFHNLKPNTALITNADGDHFDAFADLPAYEEAFVRFFRAMPTGGTVIAHGGDAQVAGILQRAGKSAIDADTEPMAELGVPGLHMRQNAQLVVSLARLRGIAETEAVASLKTFTGTWRRMEERGVTFHDVPVIDDYAHHPKEITSTIAAIREKYPKHRLVVVFEPHTNDRIFKLWKDFIVSFSEANLVLVTKVFDARPDKDKEKADVSKLAAEIGRTCKVSCRPTASMEKTKAVLESLLKKNDVLLIMGAGNSTKLATSMVE